MPETEIQCFIFGFYTENAISFKAVFKFDLKYKLYYLLIKKGYINMDKYITIVQT